MQIDKSRMYEVHRPKELGDMNVVDRVQGMLPKDQFSQWMEARERADSAGPMMIGGMVSKMPGKDVYELFMKALLEGANPCFVDEETKQVHLGHFLFVPVPETD